MVPMLLLYGPGCCSFYTWICLPCSKNFAFRRVTGIPSYQRILFKKTCNFLIFRKINPLKTWQGKKESSWQKFPCSHSRLTHYNVDLNGMALLILHQCFNFCLSLSLAFWILQFIVQCSAFLFLVLCAYFAQACRTGWPSCSDRFAQGQRGKKSDKGIITKKKSTKMWTEFLLKHSSVSSRLSLCFRHSYHCLCCGEGREVVLE